MILRSRKQPSQEPDLPQEPLRPETPFFAIGDVHGCDRLLDRLLHRLDKLGHPEALLVMVGDYVDRGEETARVLRRMTVLSEAAGDLMHWIMGNHEKMLLDTLDDPVANGPRWLRYGGLQTLASYRVPPVLGERPEAEWIDMRDRLAEALGEATIAWMRGLPLTWQTGNVVVVHAGADPALPIAGQERGNFLWGHPDFRPKAPVSSVAGQASPGAFGQISALQDRVTGVLASGRSAPSLTTTVMFCASKSLVLAR